MKVCLCSLIAAAFVLNGSFAAAADDAKKKPETKDVTVDNLKLTVPKTWKQVKPMSRLRTGQFEIPPVKGEKEKVEYVIYHFAGGGGGVGANVKRWIDQFQAKGRKVKVTKGKSEQGPYVLVDISGTYNKPIGPPIRRKTKPTPDARMLAVILGVTEKRKVYYIKVAGGNKTVTANADEIRTSFGGDAKTEEAMKLPGQEKQ